MEIFFITASFLLYLQGYAQWDPNLSLNTPVAAIAKSQSNVHCVGDSKNGIIMTWEDNRNSSSTSYDIYTQRLNSLGFEKWASTGLAICTSSFIQRSPAIVASDNGGAIITWEDERAGNTDIYAQKIDSSGNVLWTANGVAICNKTTAQKNPKIVSDNLGGAIIVWEDSLNSYWDIYAQHISAAGTLLWASGGATICNAPNTQANPKIDTDGLGGAVIVWQDKRNNIDYDIYAQSIDGTGSVKWTVNGVAICSIINTQSNPRIEPDGSNGAIIGWVDKRNGTDYDVYAQRINSTGVVQWTSNGVAVCNSVGNQSALEMKYLGTNGVVFSWKDIRSGSYDIYAQLVSLGGVPQLASNGIKISNALRSLNPNAVPDGSGGAVIAWQDSTANGWNISSQRINSTGGIMWAAGGIPVCNATDDQINVSQVSDGNGGAIYCWDDHRNGTDYDIYAQHLYYDGSPVLGIKQFSRSDLRIKCYPNPISSNSVVRLEGNDLRSWHITIYNSFGEKVSESSMTGDQDLLVNSEMFNAGVYFYVVSVDGETSCYKGSFISLR